MCDWVGTLQPFETFAFPGFCHVHVEVPLVISNHQRVNRHRHAADLTAFLMGRALCVLVMTHATSYWKKPSQHEKGYAWKHGLPHAQWGNWKTALMFRQATYLKRIQAPEAGRFHSLDSFKQSFKQSVNP